MLGLAAMGCSDGPESSATAGDPPGYPPGPYGVEEGDTIADFQLETSTGDSFALSSLYRADAEVAVLYVTATWCFTCGPEIDWLNDYPPRVSGRIVAMSVLLQNRAFEDATAADAAQYAEEYGPLFATLLDPHGDLDVFRGGNLIPLNLVIDTRAMRITHRAYGFDRTSMEQAVEALLAQP